MPAVTSPGGGDLFIVDNSVSGWTGLEYLREWADVSDRFDIATGFFEIGSLLELDGQWQKIDKIRVLVGADVTHSTRAAFVQALKETTESRLDQSLESEKRRAPFLEGVDAIVARFLPFMQAFVESLPGEDGK